jgi:hypothetical protein
MPARQMYSGSKDGGYVSMSASGNPYDNAKAESFFTTLRCI